MQDSNQDNRTHTRHHLSARARLLFTGNQPINVRTLDVSLDGVSVVADIAIPINIKGLLEINFPVGNGHFEIFSVNIKILHSIFSNHEDGFKVGVQFILPPPNLLKAIQLIIK